MEATLLGWRDGLQTDAHSTRLKFCWFFQCSISLLQKNCCRWLIWNFVKTGRSERGPFLPSLALLSPRSLPTYFTPSQSTTIRHLSHSPSIRLSTVLPFPIFLLLRTIPATKRSQIQLRGMWERGKLLCVVRGAAYGLQRHFMILWVYEACLMSFVDGGRAGLCEIR